MTWGEIRRAAALSSPILERYRQGLESLRRSGLEQANHLDTGHYLYFAAPGTHPGSGDNGEWQMWVHHASEADHPEQRMVYGRLGPDDSAVGEAAMRHLRNPQVMRSMHEQMTPGPLDETWPRRF